MSIDSADSVELIQDTVAMQSEIPTALPNPTALIINGTSYNGSVQRDYTNIINSMITTKTDATLESAKSYTDTSIENIGNEFGEIILGMYGDDFDDTADSLVTIRQIAHDEVTTAVSSKADVNHNHDDKYDTKGSADAALASAKTYADNAATQVKNDLLNGAGGAYDTLKELGDLIDDNKDAIDVLEDVAAGKADKNHDHDDRYYTETEVNNKLSEKSDANHRHNYYGVCSTAAATAAKTVDIEGFELVVGAMVVVKFTNTNSASSNVTLNVSGTGAKPIYRYGTTAAVSSIALSGWSAGAVQMFVYDGTGWIRDYWSNSTYTNASLGQGYATCSTAEATVAKAATLSSYVLTTGGIVSVKFTNAVPAGATLNVNSKSAKEIYYRGAAITGDVIKAGDIATFIYSTQYHLLSIDRWQEDIVDIQTKYDTIVDAKADWNQNDANATDYVKNRTHWVEQETEVIVPATTDRMYSYDILSGAWGGYADFDATYIVTLDGTSYQCTPWKNTWDEFCLGDSRLTTTWNDSGEEVVDTTHPEEVPFYIGSYLNDDGSWGANVTEEWYFTYPDSETHTIEIAMFTDNLSYHPLDERFIPDTIARVSDLNNVSVTAISDETIDAICGAAIYAASEVTY